MSIRKAIFGIFLIAFCFSQSGCSVFIPLYQRPTRSLGAWKSYEFEGDFACRYDGRTNQGTESEIEYVDGGTLEDGTAWALIQIDDVVPIVASNPPHHVFNRSFGLFAIRSEQQGQGSPSKPIVDIWVINERWPKANVNATIRQELMDYMTRRDYQQMSGAMIFDAGRNGRIYLEIDAKVESENFDVSIDGQIRTTVNRGHITTTKNMKGIPHNNYHPWISWYWK